MLIFVRLKTLDMGNFEEHVEYGLGAFLITASLLFVFAYIQNWSYGLLVGLLPIAFGLTLFGSLLPDIDHHNSRPFQTLRLVLPASVAIAVLAGVSFRVSMLQTLIETAFQVETTQFIIALSGFILALVCAGVTRWAIAHFRPPHRGITHTHAFNMFVFLISVLVFGVLLNPLTYGMIETVVIAVAMGASVSVGVLAHLRCDGIV